MLFWQFTIEQSILQVFCVVLHELQLEGQPLPPSPFGPSARAASTCVPASTQKPSLHTRPDSQSAFDLQAYCSLL